MGFLDILTKIAGEASGEFQQKMERIERYKRRYEELDDERLIRKYKRSSGDEKWACASLMKERGLRPDD